MSRFDSLRAITSEIASIADSPTGLVCSDKFDLALGPCVITTAEQLALIAETVADVGATHLRGGAFKLRTRIDSFHGDGVESWNVLATVAKRYGLQAISEVVSVDTLPAAAQALDVLQVGARSMWNQPLLAASVSLGLPILLKRGVGATTEDWLWTAHRLLRLGVKSLILCERGSPTYDCAPRNAVDLSTLAFLIYECPLPIWLDVSHSSGDPTVSMQLLEMCQPLGLRGAMAEVHPCPSDALCDGPQAIPLDWIRSFKSKSK